MEFDKEKMSNIIRLIEDKNSLDERFSIQNESLPLNGESSAWSKPFATSSGTSALCNMLHW